MGETSRSAYERGFEHLDKLATLSLNSHMLRHMVSDHEEEDFSKIQWGMFVLEFKRTAFDRQISEAVTIQKEAEKSSILNSKAEYNSCCLPRLVTRLGDRESEIKEFEKEILEERKADEIIEEKIRNLRKKNNKARLQTETHKTQKKRKISENTYINIREVWGQPPPTAPKKNKNNNSEETEHKNKKKRMNERLTNIKTTNNIIEGETITEFEVIETDWEKHLKEHYERLEEETNKRLKQLEKQKMKQKSWELYRECKNYLENNDPNWKQKKEERELEIKKKERLSVANEKQEKLRNKIKERKLQEEIEKGLKQLPAQEQNKIIEEEKRKERLEVKETKKNLWKLRTKEKKLEKLTEQQETIRKLDNMKEKLTTIEETTINLRNEREQESEKKRLRKEKLDKEWKEKV